jgi:hypothetical protein
MEKTKILFPIRIAIILNKDDLLPTSLFLHRYFPFILSFRELARTQEAMQSSRHSDYRREDY